MFDKLKAKKEAEAKQKERDAMDQAREAKCLPLAKYVISLIVEADLSLSEKTDEEYLATYNPIVGKILEKFLDENLKISDVTYVFKLVNEMTKNIETLLISSINNSMRIAEKALWGVDRDDKTFSLVDNVLKGWADKETVEK